MLQVQNLSYAIGERKLLSQVSWNIHPGKRVALIGPNGAGKTTLLRILNGDIELSTQHIIKPKGYRIGYLPQEEVAVGKGPMLPSVLEGLHEVLELEKQIAAIHRALDLPLVSLNINSSATGFAFCRRTHRQSGQHDRS